MVSPLSGEALGDPGRLRVLRATGLLDENAGAVLDRLTGLAARLVRAPVAMISMVDEDRQVFPSAVGLPEPWAGGTPRSHSFCRQVVASDVPLIVTDAREDWRVRDDPAIDDIGIVAYAGFPIRAPRGQTLGSFCVIDHRPRVWSTEELSVVGELAAAIEAEIATRLSPDGTMPRPGETERLRTIIAVQREVAAAAADRDTALDLIVRRAMEALPGAEGALIGLVDGEDLLVVATAGALGGHGRARVGIASSLAGRVVTSGTTVRCDDTVADDRVDHGSSIAADVRSIVIAPLLDGGRVFGTLGVSSSRPLAFDDADTEQLTLLADALTGALRHADDAAHRERALGRATEAVSALKAGEQELLQRAQLLDLTQDAVVVRDLDGRITYWNPAAERVYGWALQDAAGHDMDRLLGTIWAGDCTRESIAAALYGRDVWAGELEHRRADGRRVTVLSRKALQRDADGSPVAVLSIDTDITARRAAEQALRDSERRFRSQFAHSATGQIIRGADDVIQEVNPAFAAMLGYPGDALVGTTVAGHLTAETRLARNRELAALVTGQADSYQMQGQVIRADGSLLDVSTTVSAIRDESGRPERFVCLFQDISDRMAAEAARDAATADLADRNRELENTNRLKQDLMGMLGHEIGNPLTSILGYTETLIDGWDSLPAARQLDMMDAIDRNAHLIDGIVREVLTLVALDAGRITATPETVPVAGYLELARANSNSVTTVLDCPAGLTASVQPGHLTQILTNLLSNARKYGGGATSITARADGDTVRIAVEDHGPGVPAELRPHLFERFSRARATARTVSGTGLGLFIVRELARANGGDMHWEPAPEQGSIFVLTIPA
ncbi:hypothetical protein GCM10009828_018980 [Actinoplanes couchii]|uniref:histidine kinase n=2 Tax=Actinoplanes couchii TaxID=403638 RepID=A0ABQ3XDS6_9ACTN|nr:hypothetical protein Aco03nite_050710 [Actinoplanes couchii]